MISDDRAYTQNTHTHKQARRYCVSPNRQRRSTSHSRRIHTTSARVQPTENPPELQTQKQTRTETRRAMCGRLAFVGILLVCYLLLTG